MQIVKSGFLFFLIQMLTLSAFMLNSAKASELDATAAELTYCLADGGGSDEADVIERCASLYGVYQRALAMFNIQKALLDIALRSGSITEEEYDEALGVWQAAVDVAREAWLSCRDELIARVCFHLIF